MRIYLKKKHYGYGNLLSLQSALIKLENETMVKSVEQMTGNPLGKIGENFVGRFGNTKNDPMLRCPKCSALVLIATSHQPLYSKEESGKQ